MNASDRRNRDLERLRQTGIAVMGAQQAITQAVESAYPHATGIDRQHRRQAHQHFLGGFIGKVTASTPPEEIWPVWISQAMRVVSTRVLPEPAPAKMSADWAGSVTRQAV
jgi:hypothetical protein